MRLSLSALLAAAALAVAVPSAFGQLNSNCARDVTMADLREADAEAMAIGTEFRDAFSGMALDTATSTVSTVGATLMGSALTKEVGASVAGLRHMLALREEVPGPAREIVVDHLAMLMRESGIRMRSISAAFGQVTQMANVESVQVVSAQAEDFTDTLSKRWKCE